MKKTSSPRVDSILQSLTLPEKIKLLGGQDSSEEQRDGDIYGVERVGLPPLRFADGPVGVHWWTKASTCYPALVCLAASFDVETAFRFGEAIGTDCRSAGVHVLLAPGVNLYRSPLCGRNFEYLGESPELSGALAVAYIRGVQSMGVAATVKHFAANNQEYDRNMTSSDVDERTLREVYLRPFEMAVREGHVGCVMTSYNPVNQVHASENEWLLREILREEWGFEGVVMSDWVSVYSTAQTLRAGLDLEMPNARFLTAGRILPLLESGVLTLDVIDRAVRKRLELMERFGWLESEHRQQDESLPSPNPRTEEVALEVARKGIVLLKNEADFLPKPPSEIRRIVVLGHQAIHPILCGGGSAACPPHSSITLIEALRSTYGEGGDGVRIDAFHGVDLWREKDARLFPKFLTPDGEEGLLAEYFENNRLEGLPTVVRVDGRPSFDWLSRKADEALGGSLFSVRWTGAFDVEVEEEFDFYLSQSDGETNVWLDGEPLFSKVFDTRRNTVRISSGRHAVRIEFQAWRDGWKTCHFGFEPAARAFVDYENGLAAARESDLVIVAAGFVTATEGEGHDRDFALDPRMERLICDASEANRNTAVVLYSGGAVDVSRWIERVSGVLCLWYPGQNGALAAAEILAGKVNPSGKLPFTWEARAEDRGSFGCYLDEDGDRRVAYADGVFTGYRWFDLRGIQPLFPFGHGLSYTKFAHGQPRRVMPVEGGAIRIEVDVTNIGEVAGEESALLFMGPCAPAVLRPAREFKAARRVALNPGETKTVAFDVPRRAFARWDADVRAWVVDPGDYFLETGPSADPSKNRRISFYLGK